MRADFALLFCTLFSSAAASVIQQSDNVAARDVDASSTHEFWKRRGGGGGGSRGGGSSGGSKGGSSSGGSSSGGSSGGSKSGGSSGGSSSGGSSKSGSTSSGSNSGGSSSTGSGPKPQYGGGHYYGGGASVPYRAGGRSSSGIVPGLLIGSAIAFWPGHWYHPIYLYDYGKDTFTFHNVTTGHDQTLPVVCACPQYSVCGCDDNKNQTYLHDLVGNGSYAALNKSVIDVGRYKGKWSLLLNGTLPNGTTSASSTSGAGGMSVRELLGLGPAIAAVFAAVYLV